MVKDFSDTVLNEEDYSYDAAGNITDAPESCFVYDTNNRLTVFNGSPVTYDLDGNMLSNGCTCFEYDSANRLIKAGGHAYTYNAEDVRIRNLCGEVDTTYTYDTNSKLSQLLEKTTNGVVTKYVYGMGLIGEECDGAFKTYHFDSRGSTVAITDINGVVTDAFTYDTYGNLVNRCGSSDVVFGYNGRDGVITDKNGLIYMRARYYSPEMRRFVNADIIAGSISNAITLNRYAYANGNPVSFIDPFGLWSLKDTWKKATTWVKKNVVDPVVKTSKKVVKTVAKAVNRAISVNRTIQNNNNKVRQKQVEVIQKGAASVSNWVANAYDDVKDAAQNAATWTNDNIVQPVGKALSNAGTQIKDGFNSVVDAVSDNVGCNFVAGKEETTEYTYYFLNEVETGVGYNKSFGDEKPVTLFASAGENWWEFWEWSAGIDVNIDGVGAGISIGPETSLGVHAGNVSFEGGVNALGRSYYKMIGSPDDGYVYEKHSANGPECFATAVALYYGGCYAASVIYALLSNGGYQLCN